MAKSSRLGLGWSVVLVALWAGCDTESTGSTPAADAGGAADSQSADSSSSDAASSAEAAVDAAGGDAIVSDATPEAAPDAASDAGAEAAADATPDVAVDAPVDAPADAADAGLCVAFPDTASLVSRVNMPQALPAFTGGTISDGLYHLVELITYTGPGGASGTSTGTFSQTQSFAGNVWSGIVTAGASTQSWSATIAYSGNQFTVTKTCGTLNAMASNYTVVSATEVHLQAGASGIQVLKK